MTDTTARPPYLVARSPGYVEYQLPISVKLVVDYHGTVPLLRSEPRRRPGEHADHGQRAERG